MPGQSRASKAIERRIEAIFYSRCRGVEINVLDIARVFKVGRAAIMAGADPEPAIVDFVDTIRQN